MTLRTWRRHLATSSGRRERAHVHCVDLQQQDPDKPTQEKTPSPATTLEPIVREKRTRVERLDRHVYDWRLNGEDQAS